MKNKIILFGWRRGNLTRFVYDKLPIIQFPPSNNSVCILTSKYQFIFERQIRLMGKYNLPNGYINKIFHFLKLNNKKPQTKQLNNGFKLITRYGKIIKQYPYDGVLYRLYKISFDSEVLDNLNTIDSFIQFSNEIQKHDIENEINKYVHQLYIKSTSP